jgi:hypothetical protein
LEYDLVIKATKLINGEDIAKFLAKPNCKSLGLHYIFSQSGGSVSQTEGRSLQVMEKYISSSWYKVIVNFLQNVQPPNFDMSKVRSLKLKDVKYCIIN